MTDDQIEGLLARTERNIGLETLSLPIAGWGLVALSIGALVWAGLAMWVLLWGPLLLIPAIKVTREALRTWREFKRTPTPRLWRAVTDNPSAFPTLSSETSELKTSLRVLYSTDRRGEVLPLLQAIRLLLIYDLQQKRRQTILERIAQMRSVREQLVDKAARLRELGDTSANLTAGVDEMRQEVEALQKLSNDILASCHRLEAIVLSVQRAVQVKQLHREIADLKSAVSPTQNKSAQLAAPELTDIERQIGREIETFLQLERETDQRLRDV